MSFERVSQAAPGRIVILAEPGSRLQSADSDLGLVNEFQIGYRLQLVDKNTTLYKESYLALKAHTIFLRRERGKVGDRG